MAWIVLAIVVAMLGLLLIAPLPIELSAQGRGAPDGSWALAGGAQSGPLAAAALAADGVEATVTLLIFGRRVYSRPLARLLETKKKKKAQEEPPRTLAERWAELERWVDPRELVGFVVRERRRVRILHLDVDLSYSFEDIATTGKLLGALYALAAVLPGQIRLRQNASWDAVDRGSLALAGKIRVWPGLLFLDTLVWLAKHLRFTRQKPAAPGATA